MGLQTRKLLAFGERAVWLGCAIIALAGGSYVAVDAAQRSLRDQRRGADPVDRSAFAPVKGGCDAVQMASCSGAGVEVQFNPPALSVEAWWQDAAGRFSCFTRSGLEIEAEYNESDAYFYGSVSAGWMTEDDAIHGHVTRCVFQGADMHIARVIQ